MLLTIPFNIAGRCPVLSLPSGLSSDGVPTGVQVVGRTYDDDTVFHIGAALERTGPGFGASADWRPPLEATVGSTSRGEEQP
jgi:Asp-tRNA(Asn)/Glu-tRNA(Gln) amidotransferase A subunit family amidase